MGMGVRDGESRGEGGKSRFYSLISIAIFFGTFPPKQRNIKLQKTALSVLINMCSLNAELLPLLSQEINLVDLQKRIAIDKYGILACKMNLVLHDCGHLLTEEDIRNFLKYTTKDLGRFR